MLTAARAMLRSASSSDPLPEVPALAALKAAGVVFRRGQLVMVAGRPKAGKSNFILWMVAQMGLRTLYVSADTSAYDSTVRLSACVTGHTAETVRRGVSSPGGASFYADACRTTQIQWCFDSSPSVEDLWLELDAYVEAWDQYPEIIVIDVLMKVQASEEYAGAQYVMTELSGMARLTGATVFVLHHATESPAGTGSRERKDPSMPPASKDILNKLNQLPEIILTVANVPDSREFRVAPVMQRSGPCWPDGSKFITLDVDFERTRFAHHVPRTYGSGWGYNPEDQA